MAIRFTWAKLPVDENGKSYDSLEAFQVAQIAKLLAGACDATLSVAVSEAVMENKTAIMEILELTTDARPGERGKKKPRKPKPAPVPAQSDLPRVAAGAA